MSKDLFDDSTMSFGEHLEVLRVHLWKAIIGLVIGVLIALWPGVSNRLIVAIQAPVNRAMLKHFAPGEIKPLEPAPEAGFFSRWFSSGDDNTTPPAPDQPAKDPAGQGSARPEAPAAPVAGTPAAPGTAPAGGEPGSAAAQQTLMVQLNAVELLAKLHQVNPDRFPAPPADAPPVLIEVPMRNAALDNLMGEVRKELINPRTDGPDEAFMIYLKVSLIVGLLISSPWVFYQLWLFVAAGLYPHERKYVYTYLPMSITLFLGGALFCFFAVIPYVLDFLFGFNTWLNLRPEMKISTWISFALTVSLMFGISFQLPLVMLFLERISIFEAQDYREKRRVAILVISIISMILTPSDPVSMTLMMVPLVILYEFGILLCGTGQARKSPFETQPA